MSEFFSDETMERIAEAQLKLKAIQRRYDLLSKRFHPRSDLFREIQRELANARLKEDPFAIKTAVELMADTVREGIEDRDAAFPLVTPGIKGTRWTDTVRDLLLEEGEAQYTRSENVKSLFSSKFGGRDRTPGEEKAWKKFQDLQRFSLSVKDDFRALLAHLKKTYLRAEREYTGGA